MFSSFSKYNIYFTGLQQVKFLMLLKFFSFYPRAGIMPPGYLRDTASFKDSLLQYYNYI